MRPVFPRRRRNYTADYLLRLVVGEAAESERTAVFDLTATICTRDPT